MIQLFKSNSRGFTLIEIIGVLVILGIISALAVPKYIDFLKEAKLKKAVEGVIEFNMRERGVWSQVKLADEDDLTIDTVDGKVFEQMEKIGFELNSGTNNDWKFEYSESGSEISGKLTFQGEELSIYRTPSTLESPGVWRVYSGPAVSQDPKERLTFNMEYLLQQIGINGAPRWDQDPYEHLELDKWESLSVDHVIYQVPDKNRVGIRPENGYEMIFTFSDGTSKKLQNSDNYNLYYYHPTETSEAAWYWRAKDENNKINFDPDNEILPESLQLKKVE